MGKYEFQFLTVKPCGRIYINFAGCDIDRRNGYLLFIAEAVILNNPEARSKSAEQRVMTDKPLCRLLRFCVCPGIFLPPADYFPGSLSDERKIYQYLMENGYAAGGGAPGRKGSAGQGGAAGNPGGLPLAARRSRAGKPALLTTLETEYARA
mgnify:CR=1 FL=1